MMLMIRTFLLVGLAFGGLACGSSAQPLATPVSDKPIVVVEQGDNSEEIEKLADALELGAKQDEPAVTAILQTLTKAAGGELVGLEHRLKKRASMLRKIRLQVPKRAIADVVISDALRYTMRVEDEPDGLHVSTIINVVKSLEGEGHKVVKIKNYWPKGDNYSGVNSVFKSPSGLLWELQFHTQDSLRIQKLTRDAYEELRQADTSVERKRELFEQMSLYWDEVELPMDVLKPNLLHSTEKIIQLPSP